MQYLFNVQRSIGNNSTLEVGYTGNQSRKVAYLVNANAPVPGVTPFDAREPYPEWHGIQYLVSDGIANYNALSGKFTSRFGANLTAMFSYTWSKAMDENSAIRGTGSDFTLENQRCRSCDYSYAGYDIPHRFVSSVLYTLPFGRGQRFLDHGGVVNQVIGGWQLGSILPFKAARRSIPIPGTLRVWARASRIRIASTASREWIR